MTFRVWINIVVTHVMWFDVSLGDSTAVMVTIMSCSAGFKMLAISNMLPCCQAKVPVKPACYTTLRDRRWPEHDLYLFIVDVRCARFFPILQTWMLGWSPMLPPTMHASGAKNSQDLPKNPGSQWNRVQLEALGRTSIEVSGKDSCNLHLLVYWNLQMGVWCGAMFWGLISLKPWCFEAWLCTTESFGEGLVTLLSWARRSPLAQAWREIPWHRMAMFKRDVSLQWFGGLQLRRVET